MSIIEALGEPVHITLGTYTNIKVSCYVQRGGLLGDCAAPQGDPCTSNNVSRLLQSQMCARCIRHNMVAPCMTIKSCRCA